MIASATWLIVASDSLVRPIAARAIRRHGLQPLFASDLAGVLRLLARTKTCILAVIPPVAGPDCFALVHTARRYFPHMASVIVLGRGRLHDAGPRLLWTSPDPVPLPVQAAVAEVGNQHGGPPLLAAWDERPTRELPRIVAP